MYVFVILYIYTHIQREKENKCDKMFKIGESG